MRQKEIWKPLKENKAYHISNMGRLKGFIRWNLFIDGGQIITPSFNRQLGAFSVGIKLTSGGRVTVSLHMLVAQYFVKNPKKYKHVYFLDGDKTNIQATNLVWCEYKKFHRPGRTCTMPKGKLHGNYGIKRNKAEFENRGHYVVRFESVADAANALMIGEKTLRRRVASCRKKWLGYTYELPNE